MAPGRRRYIRLVQTVAQYLKKSPARFGGAVVTAGVVVGSVAGCSSPPEPNAPPGSLVSGTAEITVNDQNLGKVDAVSCTPAGDTMTITTGDQNSGTTTLISNADKQSVKAVTIRNLGGFTGSYTEDLGGSATVTMTGGTYAITGNADGFKTDAPSYRANGTFTIKVAC
ncbi:N/A [soil metagenome]